jgi:hypothetical protein
MWPYTESENSWISRPQDSQTALVLEKMNLEMIREEKSIRMFFSIMLMLSLMLAMI